jgi:hypothetical protein
MGFKQAARAMVAQAWCGFYLAVRVEGIDPGRRDVRGRPRPA